MAIGYKTGGRKPGSVNKTTSTCKEMIAKFVNDKAESFVQWIERIAETDPHKAADLYLKALEYNLPKLARTEMSGLDGKDLIPQSVEIKLVRPNATRAS